MLDYLENFFQTTSFLAHGYCLTWRGDLLALHAISDAATFLSYVLIPMALLYFMYMRADLAHKGIFALFAAFILSCGATHLISLVTLWTPVYGLEGVIKALTAAVSIGTVFALAFAMPKALRLPSHAMLRAANQSLIDEVNRHERTNNDLARVQSQLHAHMTARAREMEEKANELEQANESLRRFAHVASHDLQEPLRKISVYADLLEQATENGDVEDARRAAERLRAMSGQARTMVADLLRFSKMRQYDATLSPIDLGEVLGEIAELYDQMIAAREGRLDIAVDGLTVQGDPLLVRQIFQNIVGNALKYTLPPRIPHVRITMRRHANGCTVCVADNGIGFDPALKSRIFEPFTRLHGRDVADGSGIGLAVVARAAYSMGWAVDVDSTPDSGTTFMIDIPESGILAPR